MGGWSASRGIGSKRELRLSARRKANSDGIKARYLWTLECNACCLKHRRLVRDKPCSTGFYAPRDKVVRTSLFAPCCQGVVKCLFRRLYSARSWDEVVVGTVHDSGVVAAAPAHCANPRAVAGRSCRTWKRLAQSKRQPIKITSINLLNLQLSVAASSAVRPPTRDRCWRRTPASPPARPPPACKHRPTARRGRWRRPARPRRAALPTAPVAPRGRPRR